MEYSIEQIVGFADEHIRRLMNCEDIAESLPNREYLYYGAQEDEYSQAIRSTNPNSRLFRATFED